LDSYFLISPGSYFLISPGGLVIAASAADEDQRHQSDPHSERDHHPESHRDPAGEADVCVSNAAPEEDDDHDDGQDQGGSERQRQPAADQSVEAVVDHCKSIATFRKSSMNLEISDRRVASSGARSSAEGWTVTNA